MAKVKKTLNRTSTNGCEYMKIISKQKIFVPQNLYFFVFNQINQENPLSSVSGMCQSSPNREKQ